MADSVFLDEVVGFLHNIDDPTVSGAELLLSLDKDGPLLSLPDTDIAFQLLDVSPIDGLFSSSEDDSKDHHSAATDSDCTSVETESVASASSPRTTEVAVESIRSRDAIRRSSYRQKRKAEKAELYKEVEELSTQLADLQNREGAVKARGGLGLAQTAVWKALANRHLEARLIAEEQQRRLREAVERRSTLIRDLGVIIRKRISEEQQDGDHTNSPSKRARIESPDMALYETFINELDEVYARTDSICKESEMQASLGDGVLFNPTRALTRKSSHHELIGKSISPFPFDRVRALVGQVKCMENRLNCEKIQLPGVSDDTTVVKFRIQARVGNALGSLVQHAITRRYYETDRVVIVWRKFTEGEGVYAGMHSDETGWNIVRPSSDGAGTVMESIIRYVPMSFSTVAGAGGKLTEFTDTIIAAGEEDCQACLQKLETLLLDDALGVC
ncbi:hypothetical protein PC121_g4281 [Phytophthora cactorum]|nr:hypothetical protein PC120_g8948 [Phytophthora cactorum]KAG3089533.1 hypothetical protein PC121_g4281 [Phytophthora cactorum]